MKTAPGRFTRVPAVVVILVSSLLLASPATARPGPGEATRFAPAETDMVLIPGGTFVMGCAATDGECFEDERPTRRVTITQGFWMDVSEVTVAAYRRFARATGQSMPPAPSWVLADSQPVTNVTWDDAAAYCSWAGGRLPTEAEWEYAARGGNEAWKYPWGATASHEHANWDGVEGRDRWSRVAPVGSFEPNAFGLLDMAGNAWEWTGDWFDAHTYSASPAVDPGGPPSGTLRAVRGGAFNVPPRSLRVSNRGKFSPAARNQAFGFRCVRPVQAGQAAGAPSPLATPPPTPPIVQPAGGTTTAGPKPTAPVAVPVVAAIPPAAGGAPVPAGSTTAAGTRRSFPPAMGEMAHVPAATFEMGAVRGDGSGFSDEQPRHAVTITRAFWIGVTEVTFAQYRTFAEATGQPMPRVPNWADESHPVVGVTYDDAVAYCRWAGGRLPSEAEWEYAARSGAGSIKYPWGGDISHDDANFDGTGGRDQWMKSSPVASFPPNGLGLFDVSGNVWEWCADWYEERFYARSPAIDPTGPAEGKARVVRSGCWTSDPGRLRTSYRFSLDPSDSQVSVGFRCVRDAQ
jgi:formylglycine-generating enzyme required for sulfatase activity